MKTKLLYCIAFTGSLMISCEKEEAVFYRFDESSFTAKQKKWTEQNIQNYKFDQYYMSSATGPVAETIIVQNGTAYSSNEDQSVLIGTISDVYARVLNDFNQGKNNPQRPIYGITVAVKYHTDYNFPEEIKFSTSYKEDIVGGAWYELKISDFEILE